MVICKNPNCECVDCKCSVVTYKDCKNPNCECVDCEYLDDYSPDYDNLKKQKEAKDFISKRWDIDELNSSNDG